MIRELDKTTTVWWTTSVGVRSGGAGARSLDEGQVVHLHGAHDRLLRLGSLHTDWCWLCDSADRLTRLPVHIQRTPSTALYREFHFHTFALAALEHRTSVDTLYN